MSERRAFCEIRPSQSDPPRIIGTAGVGKCQVTLLDSLQSIPKTRISSSRAKGDLDVELPRFHRWLNAFGFGLRSGSELLVHW